MYPAFQPDAAFAVGLNADNPFAEPVPAASAIPASMEDATAAEERPARIASTTPVIVPLGVRHNRHFIEANTKPVDIAHLRMKFERNSGLRMVIKSCLWKNLEEYI